MQCHQQQPVHKGPAVADLIIGAIEKNRYMVITSMDIKLLYLLKRTFPPLYGLILRFMTWCVDKVLTRDSLSSRT